MFIVKWRTLVFKDFQLTLKIVVCKSAVTLASLPMGKGLLPMGKQPFVRDRFSQRELASGKFPWIR